MSLDALRESLSVSRETTHRFLTHRHLLEAWAPRINLMGPREFEDYWHRHVLDCAQLLAFAPDARHWVDIGSGAGFPGLILAAMLADTPGAKVDLVEASAKKCAFLREAARAMAVPATVQFCRIETAIPGRIPQCDVITARALAPLSRLINHAKPLLDHGAVGLFLKGADAESELFDAGFVRDGGDYRRSDLIAEAAASKSDPRARVIKLRTI
ncbi:MAG: 16S rRNA (guanine(527)-N(7))-methyltransferase RsmG [Alphaproteobacteria bacterium]|nr:16S rRNA (guanine(527)-N(7))-methyltransferase RsmG [Alphaproteobacteria bacterium]